jgi:hypothetical protein
MTLDVRLNGQSLRDLLAGPPLIKDQLNAVCRTLDIKVRAADGLVNFIGQPIELWYGGKLWYFGFMFKRGYDSVGNVNYLAYDPLYYWKKNPNDYYFKNMTGTQIAHDLGGKVGTKIGTLANTRAVFPQLYYPGAVPDKILIDTLARTAQQTGKKYWYRYDPVEGLVIFERIVPSEIWAFQVGVNLTSARYEESIEETATVIKLVNRETGKTVTRADAEAIKRYGHMVHFEEVDKEAAPHMERKAQELLKNLAKVKITSSLEGINPDGVMPQLYSGDVIYVEEDFTQLIGAYHIQNITQTFVSDSLVQLGIDVQEAPDVPLLQYQDATKKPEREKGDGVSTNPTYNEEMKKVMEKYGL